MTKTVEQITESWKARSGADRRQKPRKYEYKPRRVDERIDAAKDLIKNGKFNEEIKEILLNLLEDLK